MKKIIRPRWFYLAHVNCDCASYNHAWLRQIHSGEWRHCIYCRKKLGDMEIMNFGAFKARDINEAWEMKRAAPADKNMLTLPGEGGIVKPERLEKT
jgi:hypothetical protein